MPYLLRKKKDHVCYKPSARYEGSGALWQCSSCGQIWILEVTATTGDKLIDHSWRKISSTDAAALLEQAKAAEDR